MRVHLLRNLLVGLCLLALLSVALVAGSRSVHESSSGAYMKLQATEKTDMPWEALARQLMGSVSL